jgi:hypothetical protein
MIGLAGGQALDPTRIRPGQAMKTAAGLVKKNWAKCRRSKNDRPMENSQLPALEARQFIPTPLSFDLHPKLNETLQKADVSKTLQLLHLPKNKSSNI